MKFLSPLPGLEILSDAFPQLSLWATIVRRSAAKLPKHRLAELIILALRLPAFAPLR
jgi:hypothetical protein